MKTTRLSRQEIMRLPEGIHVKSVPRIVDGKHFQFEGTLIFQLRSMQEDDEELFGIFKKDEWITFDIKPGNLIITNPAEIENPPTFVVRCQYFKAKKDKPEYIIIRVLYKKEDKVFAVTKELKEIMQGAPIKYFQAILFSGDIKLVREIADPTWQQSLEQQI